MGAYINPSQGSKEEFLMRHGKHIDPPREFDWNGDTLPVCLVYNPDFTAAGIAYCKAVAEEFMHPCGRRKVWFEVSREALKPYYSVD